MESSGTLRSGSDTTDSATVQYFHAADAARVAFRQIGAGRPVLLIHGFFSNAVINWVKYGHAEKIAAQGFRVILPDLRGHGESARPHDPAAYPRDVLTDDADMADSFGGTRWWRSRPISRALFDDRFSCHRSR